MHTANDRLSAIDLDWPNNSHARWFEKINIHLTEGMHHTWYFILKKVFISDDEWCMVTTNIHNSDQYKELHQLHSIQRFGVRVDSVENANMMLAAQLVFFAKGSQNW